MAETKQNTPKTSTKAPTTRARAKKQTTADVTTEEIAARAYEISQSDVAGSSEENWLRAEQELRGRATEVAP